MATQSNDIGGEAALAALEEVRRDKLARMARRFDELDRRLTELENRLQQAEEEFRPKQPR